MFYFAQQITDVSTCVAHVATSITNVVTNESEILMCVTDVATSITDVYHIQKERFAVLPVYDADAVSKLLEL